MSRKKPEVTSASHIAVAIDFNGDWVAFEKRVEQALQSSSLKRDKCNRCGGEGYLLSGGRMGKPLCLCSSCFVKMTKEQHRNLNPEP